jgi:hypothetical protein
MMEAEGLGHIPNQMVERLEAATGNTIPPGYKAGLEPMFHLWQPLRAVPRPLLFYLVAELLALWTYLIATLVLGFKMQVRS